MSKSKHNGVDPVQCIHRHGADCTRAHILFSAPVSEVLEWNEESIVGVERWLKKLWRVVTTAAEQKIKEDAARKGKARPAAVDVRDVMKMSDAEKVLWRKVQQTVVDVTSALSQTYSLNTMISDLIKLTNALTEVEEDKVAIRTDFLLLCCETLVKLTAPVAPAISEESWKVILTAKGQEKSWASVFDASWPEVEDRRIFEVADVKCAIQIDGKTRFVLDIPGTMITEKDQLTDLVKNAPDGRKWIVEKMEQQKPLDIIVAPGGRVMNFVFKKKEPRKTKV